jgi:hypothetical protein
MTIQPPPEPTPAAVQPSPSNTPAGWYPDGSGKNRYWDGVKWTDQYQDLPNVTFTDVTPKHGNGLGIASLIIGIVAFVFAIIPVLSFIAWLPAIVAIGLAIGGLIVKHRPRATAIVGLILGIVAIIVGIIVTLVSIAAVGSAITKTQSDDNAKANQTITVVYTVSSDQPASVNYDTYTDGQSGSSSATDSPMPFTKTFTVKKGGTFSFTSLLVSAVGGENTTTLSCSITYDGKELASQTATGAYSTVLCSGTPK